MKTDKIRKAVLNKARDDADKITSDAGLRASEMIEEAKDRRRQRFEKEKEMIIDEARREASKILTQASLKARQEILKQKNAVINEIIAKVKNKLKQAAPEKNHSSISSKRQSMPLKQKTLSGYLSPIKTPAMSVRLLKRTAA